MDVKVVPAGVPGNSVRISKVGRKRQVPDLQVAHQEGDMELLKGGKCVMRVQSREMILFLFEGIL